MSPLLTILNLATKVGARKLFPVLCLALLSAVFDVLGVASIFPFITLIINRDGVEVSEPLSRFLQMFGNTGQEDFLLFAGLIVTFIFSISLLLRWFAFRMQLNYIHLFEASLSEKLFAIYLEKDYVFLSSYSNSVITTRLLSLTNHVAYQGVSSALVLITQLILLTIFLLLALLIQPFISLSLFVIFALLYGFARKIFQKKMNALGEAQLQTNAGRYLFVTQALSSIRQLKIYGLEKFFNHRFLEQSKRYASAQIAAHSSAQYPRYVIEFFAFISLMSVILLNLESIDEMIPVVAMFAAALFRLMPAIQQIIVSKNQISFAMPAVKEMHSELMNIFERTPTVDGVPFVLQSADISLREITHKYNGRSEFALKKVNFELQEGQIVGIVGATGSGKSTMLDLLAGLVLPTSGVIRIGGVPLTQRNKSSWMSSIAYIPQSPHLYQGSLLENIALGQDFDLIDHDKVMKVCSIAVLSEFINSLPDGLDTKLNDNGLGLSGGQKQRIEIARALYKSPKVIICDEGTSALDTLTEKQIIDGLRNFDKHITLVMVSHRVHTLRECDIIIIMDKGSIVDSGNYVELSKNHPSFFH